MPCHVCHNLLGDIAETRDRILEDMELGRWEVIQYMVTRRWCPHCKCLRSTPVPGAMSNQRFGNRVLTMLSFLKMIGVSFRKIDLIFMVFYNVHIGRFSCKFGTDPVPDVWFRLAGVGVLRTAIRTTITTGVVGCQSPGGTIRYTGYTVHS